MCSHRDQLKKQKFQPKVAIIKKKKQENFRKMSQRGGDSISGKATSTDEFEQAVLFRSVFNDLEKKKNKKKKRRSSGS